MGENVVLKLTGELARAAAKREIDAAPLGHVVKISPPTRSLDQNAKLHAVLTDIARQVEWHGLKFDVVTWKRLCMASWLRERKESPDLIPALDGNGFDVIYERTSKLTVAQCSEFLEWCIAFGVEQGVIWSCYD